MAQFEAFVKRETLEEKFPDGKYGFAGPWDLINRLGNNTIAYHQQNTF